MAHSSSRQDVVLVEDSGMYLRAWEAAPGVVMSVSTGRASLAGARGMVRMLEHVLARAGTVFVVTDASRLVGYDPRVRELYASWYGAHREATLGVHVLAESGMLKMAVQLTTAVIGGLMVQHDDRASFERAVLALRPELDLSSLRSFPTTPIPTPRARIAP